MSHWHRPKGIILHPNFIRRDGRNPYSHLVSDRKRAYRLGGVDPVWWTPDLSRRKESKLTCPQLWYHSLC